MGKIDHRQFKQELESIISGNNLSCEVSIGLEQTLDYIIVLNYTEQTAIAKINETEVIELEGYNGFQKLCEQLRYAYRAKLKAVKESSDDEMNDYIIDMYLRE